MTSLWLLGLAVQHATPSLLSGCCSSLSRCACDRGLLVLSALPQLSRSAPNNHTPNSTSLEFIRLFGRSIHSYAIIIHLQPITITHLGGRVPRPARITNRATTIVQHPLTVSCFSTPGLPSSAHTLLFFHLQFFISSSLSCQLRHRPRTSRILNLRSPPWPELAEGSDSHIHLLQSNPDRALQMSATCQRRQAPPKLES